MDGADEKLLEAIRAGDQEALSALLARYAPAIYRFGAKMCGEPEDAKDVLQETLLAAARGIREFRGASSLSTWLYTVARSFCIKKRRVSKFAPAETLSLEDPIAIHARSGEKAPDDAAADREMSLLLDRAIASLEPASREVLVLRDVEGLTAPEVAEIIGISVDAVKSRLHRARTEVRARLEEAVSIADTRAPAPAGCPDIVTLFSRFLEGEIGPKECAEMESHVAGCKRCTAACDSLKHTLALCRAEPHAKVPPDVQERVRKALLEATGRTTK